LVAIAVPSWRGSELVFHSIAKSTKIARSQVALLTEKEKYDIVSKLNQINVELNQQKSMRKICPICKQTYSDSSNKEAIEKWGCCLGCDHLQTDNKPSYRKERI